MSPDTHIRRRSLLAAGSAVTVSVLAGCTRVSEFLTDQYTGALNLFNTSDGRVTGSIELLGPADTSLLTDQFDLPPDDSAGDRDPSMIYEDLLRTSGEHQFTVTAESATSQHARSRGLDIADPTAEQIVVFLGRRLTDEFLTIRVIEDFAELEDEFEEF